MKRKEEDLRKESKRIEKEKERKRIEGEKEKEREEKASKEKCAKEVAEKKKANEARTSSSSTTISNLVGDDDDQTDLISSLAKMIEKNKKAKNLQETVMELIERLHNTVTTEHIEAYLEQREQEVIKSFDLEFTNLLVVEEAKAHVAHDANLFNTICQNIQNDLVNLETCIRELQKCQMEGKGLYIKCTLSHKQTKDFDKQIVEKLSELEAPTVQLHQPLSKLEDFDGRIFGVHSEVWKLHLTKEQLLKRFSDFGESLVFKISAVERQLDECTKAKDTYSKFMFFDLNVVEIASYALCENLSTFKEVKDNWEKGMNTLNVNFDDCIKLLPA